MKIINEEANKEVIYVQKGDMAFIMRSSDSVPASFLDDFFTDIIIINGYNKDDFIKFSKPEQIKYLKEQEWIIDYREFMKYNEDEIKEKGQEVLEKMNTIAFIFNNSDSDEERFKLHIKYELLEYELQSIKEFLWYRQGHIDLSIPLVPDYKGFSFVGDENYAYTIQASLDPNKLLLFRKDNAELTKEEKISRDFIQMGMSIAIMEKNKKDSFFGDYVVNNSLSDDNKYLIIEFKTNKLEEKEENTIQNNKKENIPRRVKNWVLSLFNKK